MAGIVPLSSGAAMEGIEYHPLLNPVVLERLFELTPFKLQDFKNFRLVSRAWNNLSLSKWRQNAWLRLTDKDQKENEDGNSDRMDVEEAANEEEVLRGISRQEYLQLIETDEYRLVQHPFRKYYLKHWKIDLQSVNQSGRQAQIRFWNQVGPLMTHLTLEKSNFTGVADLRTVIFETTPNLQCLTLIDNVYTTKRLARRARRLDPELPQHALIPSERVQKNLIEFNIRLLGINENHDEDDVQMEAVDYLPITWMELLIHFPNIKKIEELLLDNEAELREFFKSVRILREEHGLHYLANLEDLNLQCHLLGGRLVSYINRLGFPLKRLAMSLKRSVGEKTFKELVQHPLEFLEIERLYCEDKGPFRNFPFGLKFLTLKTLNLWGSIAPNLTFLKDCPNLEKLIYKPFRQDGMEADLTLGLRDVNFPKLEKLKALWIMNNYLCTAEQIRRLSELMPNLKHLSIGLDDGSFRAVCEVWKELEKLTIFSCRVTEEAFLGKDEQSGEKYCHPNLTDLTNLKTIYMYVDGDQQGFTDAMILDGILALPNLEYVGGSCLPPQVSIHVRRQLEMKFPKSNIFLFRK